MLEIICIKEIYKTLRNEKTSNISLCNKCKKQDSCKIVNCRFIAEEFTGNRLNPKPFICKTMME